MNCHYRFYELENFFQSVHKLGMHARRHDSPEQLKKLCDRYQITIIGICPEQTNPKPNNIAVKQKHRQEEVLNYYRQMIDIACELECRQVLVTSGWCYYSETVEEAWNRSVVMMKRITDYAKSRLVNTIQDIQRYRNEVGSSCLKVCIDFGAMARMGHTPREYFEAFGSDIVHIHFVDGNPTGHLAWGMVAVI